jgi:acyl carrier protein
MVNADEIECHIDGFVRSSFDVPPDDPVFGRHADLLDGYLDSVAVVELVEHLEQHFGIRIADDDLLSDDFSTVAGLAKIVGHLVAGGT